MRKKAQYEKEAMCKLCGRENEDLIHFTMDCNISEEERKEIISENKWENLDRLILEDHMIGEITDRKQAEIHLIFIHRCFIKIHKILHKENARHLYWVRRD